MTSGSEGRGSGRALRMQSAFEYLASYGWAFLIIAIALAALYALNVFNTGNYVKTQCVIGQGLACENAILASNGVLSIEVLQSTSDPINITALGCNQNTTVMDMAAPLNPPSNQIYMAIGSSYTFNVTCYTGTGTVISSRTGSDFDGGIIINYTNDVTGLPGTVTGKIVIAIPS